MEQHILIAGRSASGKSTLARAVARQLGLRAFSLDDYFVVGKRLYEETPSGTVRNFEHPSLYDGDLLAQAAKATNRPTVIEGFCLFAYPEILALTGTRIYLSSSHETCLLRRMDRKPARPSDRSFELIGEAQAALWVEPQARLDGVVTLDGEQSAETLLQQTLELVSARRACA